MEVVEETGLEANLSEVCEQRERLFGSLCDAIYSSTISPEL